MRFVTVGGQNLCLVVPGSNQTQQLVSIQSFTWMALQRSFGPDARPAQRFLFCNYNFVVRYSNQKRCGDPSAPDPTHSAPSETNQRSGEPLRSWPIESVAWWSAEEEDTRGRGSSVCAAPIFEANTTSIIPRKNRRPAFSISRAIHCVPLALLDPE